MANASTTVLVEQLGPVRRLTLNRPEKLNAINGEMYQAIFASVDDAVADPATRVVIIAGAGRAFTAGADTKPAPPPEPSASAPSGRPPRPPVAYEEGELGLKNAPLDMAHNRGRVEQWLHLWSTPKPLIVAVHGYCLGLGNEIAGCADFVVASESARFGMPEARDFALPPTLGFWPLRVGHARTKELLWTGRLVDGKEAVEIGLADMVVSDDALASECEALAARIAEVPGARLAVVKQAVNSWAETFGVREAALRGAEYHALYHQVQTQADG
jgi:enoyl-CoA hydratase